MLSRLLEAGSRKGAAVQPGLPREDGGQHIGAISVRAAVVLRTWLALRVGFDEEAAEVGDDSIDLSHFMLPPSTHSGIEWVGAVQAADLDGRRESRQ